MAKSIDISKLQEKASDIRHNMPIWESLVTNKLEKDELDTLYSEYVKLVSEAKYINKNASRVSDKEFNEAVKLNEKRRKQLEKQLSKFEKIISKQKQQTQTDDHQYHEKEGYYAAPEQVIIQNTPSEEPVHTQGVNSKARTEKTIQTLENRMPIEEFNKKIDQITNDKNLSAQEKLISIANLCAAEQRRASVKCPNTDTLRLDHVGTNKDLTYVIQPIPDHAGGVFSVAFQTVQEVGTNDYRLGNANTKTHSFELILDSKGVVDKNSQNDFRLLTINNIVSDQQTKELSDKLNTHPIAINIQRLGENMEPITPIRNMLINVYNNKSVDLNNVTIQTDSLLYTISKDGDNYKLYENGKFVETSKEPASFASKIEENTIIQDVSRIMAGDVELTTAGKEKEEFRDEQMTQPLDELMGEGAEMEYTDNYHLYEEPIIEQDMGEEH